MDIEIAPKFTCADWDKLRPKLDPTGNWAPCPHEWARAVRVVETRIMRRFFDLAKRLERSPYAGFAILALDCLLIENLQAFRNGKNAKNSAESRATHIAFLTAAASFQGFFTKPVADAFYTNVRNGLLHDGETRKGWLVKTNPKYALLDPQPKGFVVINRRKFHAALVTEFVAYIQSLHDPAETNLRKNLVKALDDLCARSKP